MKRSEINNAMRSGAEFMKANCFHLPPFPYWSLTDWRAKGRECSDIVRQQLGWDITDFGSGAHERVGLLMFTIRNGTFEGLKRENGKIYAENVLIIGPGQVTPIHFRYQKMGATINRGGAVLWIQFWNSTPEEARAGSELTLAADGIRRRIPAGAILELRPGESVCIPQRVYHSFWGKEDEGTVLVGEVSRVNDDYVDNRFLNPIPRLEHLRALKRHRCMAGGWRNEAQTQFVTVQPTFSVTCLPALLLTCGGRALPWDLPGCGSQSGG